MTACRDVARAGPQVRRRGGALLRCGMIGLGVLLLVGCGGDPRKDLDGRLDTLVGQTESEVVRRMGKPSREIRYANGQSVLHYVVDFPAFGGPNFTVGYGNPMGRNCDIALRIVAGRVQSHSFTGDVCGVGGLPYIAP